MPTFPLVRNELLRQGRRAETYWARVGLIALVLMPLLVIAWTGWYYGTGLTVQPEELGLGLTFAAAILQFIAAFFVAPTFAASALTQEKEERTLGLLMMADLSGWGIILAKFTSVMLRVGTLMLCTAPFVGFAALFGAVDVRSALTLAVILFVCSASVAAVGIYFSTILRYSSMANSFAILFVFIAAYVFGYIDTELYPGGAMINPLFQFTLAVFSGPVFLGGYAKALAEAAVGCAIVVLFGALFLAAAVAALPAQVHQSVKRPGFLGKGVTRSSIRFWRHDPLSRLVRASVGSITMAGRNIFIRVLAFVGLGVILLMPVIGCYIVMIVLFREILMSMERLRNAGTLDDFVLVPHSDAELGRAFWWGHVTASGVYGALIAASLMFTWFNYEFDRAFLYAALPIAAAHFLAGVAMACAFGTLRVRLGMLGGYVYLVFVALGFFGPLAAYVWLRRQRWDVNSWLDLAFEGRWHTVGDRIGFNAGIFVFVAIHIALFAALTAVSCFALGRRLRKRPIFERLADPTTVHPREALES